MSKGGEKSALFPAHAGVILKGFKHDGHMFSFPRTRGGDPPVRLVPQGVILFSPHTRG